MMLKRILTVSLGVFLLLAAFSFTFSPLHTGKAEAANATVAFADNNWACTTAACTSKVGQGAAQPDYQCAEFAARSLAASGYIPGLSTKSSQSAYGDYKPGNGKTYDLLAITPSVATPKGTLANFLTTYGYFKNMGESMSDAEPGDLVVMGNNAHVVVIVSTSRTVASTLIDAHNDARHHVSLSGELSGFSGSWYLLHIQTGGA